MKKSEELRLTLQHTENKIEVIENLETQIQHYKDWKEEGDELEEWQKAQNEHYEDCISILEKAIEFITAKV